MGCSDKLVHRQRLYPFSTRQLLQTLGSLCSPFPLSLPQPSVGQKPLLYRVIYPDFDIPNSNPPVTLIFPTQSPRSITRLEARFLFQIVAHEIAAPSFPTGVVPNASHRWTPYKWQVDCLSLLIRNVAESPEFTNVVALVVIEGLEAWTKSRGRSIQIRNILCRVNGAVVGTVTVDVAPLT